MRRERYIIEHSWKIIDGLVSNIVDVRASRLKFIKD